MRLVAGIVGLFAAVTIFAVGSPNVHAQAAQTEKKPTKKVVVVKSGDSLSKIGKRYKTSYKRLFNANKQIKHPDVIYPGQKVRIPKKGEKLKNRTLPGATSSQQRSVKTDTSLPVTRQRSYTPAAAPSSASGGVWDRLAACESGGNWSINTGNGYYGGLQFSLSSWRGVGGQGYPHQASKSEQIRRGEMLRASGGWGHWPACSAKLGLR